MSPGRVNLIFFGPTLLLGIGYALALRAENESLARGFGAATLGIACAAIVCIMLAGLRKKKSNK